MSEEKKIWDEQEKKWQITIKKNAIQQENKKYHKWIAKYTKKIKKIMHVQKIVLTAIAK